MRKILVVEDDRLCRSMLCNHIARTGMDFREAPDASSALDSIAKEGFSVVILDLGLPDMDGLEAIGKMKQLAPKLQIIVLTGNGDISTAVEAIKLGAFDFFVKPPDLEKIEEAIERAHSFSRSRPHPRSSQPDRRRPHSLGTSTSAQNIMARMENITHGNLNMIILGETGTGKTHLARMVHEMSERSGGPFVKVDIGALSETLIESELFGHVKGAFTGAANHKKGVIEAANGGTLLLDEIQNISLHVQSKLLEVIENKKITPVGGIHPIDIDVRIIAAINEDPEKLIKDGKLRSDLFYRMDEITISLPPLRERREDILFFAQHHILEVCAEIKRGGCVFHGAVLDLFVNYSWPGNIRELKNVVRRAVLETDGCVITLDKIRISDKNKPASRLSLRDYKKMHEANYIREALQITNGNKRQAASLLKVSYRGLLNKIDEYDIK